MRPTGSGDVVPRLAGNPMDVVCECALEGRELCQALATTADTADPADELISRRMLRTVRSLEAHVAQIRRALGVRTQEEAV